MAKHIGIVGVSPEGAALFYSQLTRQCARLLGPFEHPRLTIHNEPLAQYIDAIRKDDWHGVARLLRRSADVLTRAGAELVLTPDNIVQHGIALAQSGSTAHWLTMTELVARAVEQDGRRVVGLIGTKLVTSSSTYQTMLGIRGVQVLAPDADEAELLDQIIFGELIYGHIRPESREAVHMVIGRLRERGCEAVILGCSEAPMVVTQENCCVPVYDAADILAESAVRHAIDDGSTVAGSTMATKSA